MDYDISPLTIVRFSKFKALTSTSATSKLRYISPFEIVKFEKEKYVNSLVAARRIYFSYEQNVKNMFKLLSSVISDHRKEIRGNYHAEI